MMDGKILWVNPSFLDYRIPLYSEMNQKLGGNFHLLYSRERIPERCHGKVQQVLGPNAHFINHEKMIKIGNDNDEFANRSLSIPMPSGLYRQMKKIKPSAIIAEGFFQFTPCTVAYSIFNRVPLYIAYERTTHTERQAPWWRKFYRKFIGLFVKGYIVNGLLTKEYLISQGVRPKKIFTGGMCADSEHLRVASHTMTEEEKIKFEYEYAKLPKKEGIRYIFVGRIIERKGIGYLLEAWREHIKQHPDDQLLIVGTGNLLDEYREKYAGVETVLFLGGVDYSQIYKYYTISDVFVIPTLEDNWSLVVPEAMACGLPVACSIYNGCYPELVKKDFNGTTFDPLIQETILEALDYFHIKDLKRMGENSNELEKQFNPEHTAKNVINMLENCR